ncbi:MAG: hypothetical protein JNK65_07065, partial [Deltaproteobacteria bacterium]|nr:hypothetical protein [Deltaproteobacteria bacterium]
MPILTARFDSLLSQLSQSTLNIDCESSSFQHQLDHTFSNATAQLTDVRTIVPMLAGSFAYSLFRSGSLAFMGSSLPSRLIAPVLGLMGEVTIFEWVGHGLRGEVPINRDPTRSDVLVEPSFMKAWFHSFVNFGLLKLGGWAGSNQNIFIQHLMQDSAMVVGNYATAALRLSERPTGSLFEQALHAEMTNIQLGFSMSVAHRMVPGLRGYERMGLMNQAPTAGGQGTVGTQFIAPLSERTPTSSRSRFQNLRNILSDAALAPLWMMMGAGGIGGGSFFRSRTNRLAQRVTVPDSSQRVIAFEMESTEQVRELEETSENSFALRMRTLRDESLLQQS